MRETCFGVRRFSTFYDHRFVRGSRPDCHCVSSTCRLCHATTLSATCRARMSRARAAGRPRASCPATLLISKARARSGAPRSDAETMRLTEVVQTSAATRWPTVRLLRGARARGCRGWSFGSRDRAPLTRCAAGWLRREREQRARMAERIHTGCYRLFGAFAVTRVHSRVRVTPKSSSVAVLYCQSFSTTAAAKILRCPFPLTFP